MAVIIEPTEAEVEKLSATLKSCPFCGSPSEVEWTPVPDFSGRSEKTASISWHVRCTAVGSRCPMGQHWLCSTSGEAVRAWNQRKEASLERVTALESELRIIAAELTEVVQTNIAEGVPPALTINHRLNSVMRVLAGK